MPIKHSVMFTVEWQPPGKGDPIELEIQVMGEITPGSGGQPSGPPERCYPPEPTETDYTGFELVEVPRELDEYLQDLFEEDWAANAPEPGE